MDVLGRMWRSVVFDDETRYPDTTGCPELPPAIKDIAYWVMCIAGETAEMLNLVKKRWRNGHWDPSDFQVTGELVSESIDVIIYLIELYEELGVDEEFILDVFIDKRYELHARWQQNGDLCSCKDCQKFRENDPERSQELQDKVRSRKVRVEA